MGCVMELAGQVREILITVKDFKHTQEELKVSLEKKIDSAKNEMTHHIDTQINILRDQLTFDLSKESLRIDGLLTSVQNLQDRLESLEHSRVTDQSINGTQRGQTSVQINNPLNDPDLTVIASGLPFNEGEDILARAKDLIKALGEETNDSVSVQAARRLPSRFPDKPGWVKISFRTLQEKITVLRKKMSLQNHASYNNVFLKNSKSPYQRINEDNARMLLRNIPKGNNFRIDANGRIKERTAKPSAPS
ncbi:uncharacterized protein LOC132750994 isoform X2 [Ruditapes philippinarum]|uniref:uncharacterized protein LOC132750994 isoform X2 n=1 Tax=Ruditapes philippinarum TaxID=129788 RepID=UPI00295AE343|nr:uncharacterized protein LOC132750994 isoform X2 [Ruditapes philippinarum]